MSIPGKGHRFRLGELVLRNGLAPVERVEGGLAVQDRVRRMGLSLELGEILVRQSDLETRMRDALLQIQEHIEPPQRPIGPLPTPPPPGKPAPFGQVAMNNAVLRPAELQTAVTAQRVLLDHGVRRPLGDILVAEGVMTPEERDAVLQVQSRRIARTPQPASARWREPQGVPPHARDLFLGVIAVACGFVDEAERQAAVAWQRSLRSRNTAPPLGEALRVRGSLTHEQVSALLDVQDQRQEAFYRECPPPANAWWPPPQDALGSLLRQRGLVEDGELRACLSLQRSLARMRLRLRLGELLRRRSGLAASDLNAVLDEQFLRRENRLRRSGPVARLAAWLARSLEA